MFLSRLSETSNDYSNIYIPSLNKLFRVITGKLWLTKLACIGQYKYKIIETFNIYRLFRVEFSKGKAMLHLKQGQDIAFVSNQVTKIIALAILAIQIITSQLCQKHFDLSEFIFACYL